MATESSVLQTAKRLTGWYLVVAVLSILLRTVCDRRARDRGHRNRAPGWVAFYLRRRRTLHSHVQGWRREAAHISGTECGNRRCSRTAAVAACSAALLSATQGAKAATEDNGAWIGVFANGKLPPSLNDPTGSWRLWLDAQLRLGDDAGTFAQGVVRVGVGYALSEAWSLWAGYAYIRTEPPYATTATNEQRIWEQAIWNGAIGPTKLSSRTRLEQRFFSGGPDTGWRLREFVKLVQPLGAESAWSLVVSDEIFVNLNNANFGSKHSAAAGLDRNRFFVGPGINLNQTVRIEFGYMNQYTFRNNGPDKNDQILAANVFFNF
jgi:hypothetical protein